MKKTPAANSLFFILAMTSLSAPSYALYTLRDIGSLGCSSVGYGINNKGQIIADSTTSCTAGAPTHGVTTAIGSNKLIDLGSLLGKGGTSSGRGINDSGQVTGESVAMPFQYSHAIMTKKNSLQLIDLGTLYGGANSSGYGINTKGQVSGSSTTTKGRYGASMHAFITSANNTLSMIDLGTLGGQNSYGTEINKSGQITGYSQLLGNRLDPQKNAIVHAFITDVSTNKMTDIGTLGGYSSQGYGLNDKGQVAGYSDIRDFTFQHAFVTHPTTRKMIDLGTLGGNNSKAYGINSKGDTTGTAARADNKMVAFVALQNHMYDLQKLLVKGSGTGWLLQMGRSINDIGQIVGTGTYNGQLRAFVASPAKLNIEQPSHGVIRSTPVGINCGPSCVEHFTGADSPSITLSAVAEKGYIFSGWGGVCKGTVATCIVKMDTDKTVSAKFTIKR